MSTNSMKESFQGIEKASCNPENRDIQYARKAQKNCAFNPGEGGEEDEKGIVCRMS